MTEEKEYLTVSEAAQIVGLQRASLYYYINKLNIKPRRFPDNRHPYLTRHDVEYIRKVKDRPWELEDKDGSTP